MAIINSYPKGTPKAEDLLIGTDVPQEYSGKEGITKNFKITDIANLVISETGGITGSGTLNTIAMFTPNGQSIGDSRITQASLGQAINVNTNLFVSDDLNVTGSIETYSSLTVEGISTFNNQALFYDSATFLDTVNINDALYDQNSSSGTAGQVLSSTGTGNVEWINNTAPGTVTGSGTKNTLARFTSDGSVVGDSWLSQERIPGIAINYLNFEGPSGFQNKLNITDGYIITNNLEVTNITAGDTGNIDFQGNTTLGNSTSDFIWHRGTTYLTGPVLDTSNTAGTAGQILVSNATSNVEWTDAEDVVSGSIAKLIPFQVTASAGGSSAYNADNNIVEIGWTGGSGTYTLFLPTAADGNQYRNIRFVTNSTFPNGASDKVQITALPGETIDGAQFFEISKVYEGVSVWSNGTEWIIIQAKAH